MPNHVENTLSITGSVEEIDRFKKFARKGKELLATDNFIPYPKIWKQMDKEHPNSDDKDYDHKLVAYKKKWGTDKDGYNSGGYEWCSSDQGWGTKWGMYNTVVIRDTHTKGRRYLIYEFCTAWSPALPVIKKMIEMFPKIVFALHYKERGMAYQGEYEGEGGQITREEDADYQPSKSDEDDG